MSSQLIDTTVDPRKGRECAESMVRVIPPAPPGLRREWTLVEVREMVTEGSKSESKPLPFLRRLRNLLGAGLHLLLLGLLVESLTVGIRQWISLPIPLTFETRILLTVPCVAACLLGAIWFNRSLDLVGANLLDGRSELVTHGPFAYVRHPLYSTMMITIPPLVIIWLSDLLFFIPWVLMIIVAHYVVRLEERGLIEAFGEDYEEYRKYVPALLPYKGAGAQR
jgi:protein-S-isoprenylcysteine O-methyltransferase Ste14